MVLVVPPKPVVHGYYTQVVNDILCLAAMPVLGIWIAVAFNFLVHSRLWELLGVAADSQGESMLVVHENIGVDMSLGEAMRGEGETAVVVHDVGSKVKVCTRNLAVS